MTPEPEWVDLGLPSGLLWCRFNLGATKPESYGIYFSWGNTEGHVAGAGYVFSQEVYNATPAAAITEDLSLEQDAARVNLGAPWRMPSAAEFQELVDNCTNEWTTLNGVYGCLFTSNVNSKKLFFPAGGRYAGGTLANRGSRGYYWSSTLYNNEGARVFHIESSVVYPQDHIGRYYGVLVRAVRSA